VKTNENSGCTVRDKLDYTPALQPCDLLVISKGHCCRSQDPSPQRLSITSYLTSLSTSYQTTTQTRSRPLFTTLNAEPPPYHPTNSKQTRTMCKTKFLKGPACTHSWAEIVIPCAKDRGFTTCPSFTDNRVHDGRKLIATMASAESCPMCDKKNKYDGNKIRIIARIDSGFRWGTGPGRKNTGVDVDVGSRPGFLRQNGGGNAPGGCCDVM